MDQKQIMANYYKYRKPSKVKQKAFEIAAERSKQIGELFEKSNQHQQQRKEELAEKDRLAKEQALKQAIEHAEQLKQHRLEKAARDEFEREERERRAKEQRIESDRVRQAKEDFQTWLRDMLQQFLSWEQSEPKRSVLPGKHNYHPKNGESGFEFDARFRTATREWLMNKPLKEIPNEHWFDHANGYIKDRYKHLYV